METYSSDLAYVHDTAFGDVADKAATMIINALKQNSIEEGLVIDLGCGSGILAKKLLDAGYDVLGVDQSKDFIELARQRAPKGEFIHDSFFNVSFPGCVAVVSTGECLNYVFVENNKNILEQLFQRAYSALAPGGLFIFDIIEVNKIVSLNAAKIIEKSDWTMFFAVKEDAEKQTLTREIYLFRKIDGCYRKSKEVHTQQLYPREQIVVLLRQTGFDVSFFTYYGELALAKNRVGFFCKKH